jgi:hypothetical protein
MEWVLYTKILAHLSDAIHEKTWKKTPQLSLVNVKMEKQNRNLEMQVLINYYSILLPLLT